MYINWFLCSQFAIDMVVMSAFIIMSIATATPTGGATVPEGNTPIWSHAIVGCFD